MNPFVSGAPLEKKKFSGFTLIELLITIAIIAVLAGIVIAYMVSVVPYARQQTAEDFAGLLNRAVTHYNQVNAPIAIAAASGADDEMAVVALLKTRNLAAPGSPYIQADYPIIASNEIDTVRLSWTGKFFQTIPEGTAGIGIIVKH